MNVGLVCCWLLFCFFFFKQKTAYEMRISDWSSDVCSSDLAQGAQAHVENRLSLDVAQLPALHHLRLRIVLLADDADHLVEVEVGDEVAIEHLEAMSDLLETVQRLALQHLVAVIEEIGRAHV